jgi:DNA-directed RNA polymerase subunit M/transcription elongation factor TFIIS
MKPSDFCPTCHFYLYLNQQDDKLMRICRNCGYQEEDKKGGLILEIDLKEKTSEGYRILMNEFTAHDPTLPHVTSIKCPNDSCKSNTGAKERDVLYLKYDPVNLKFLYHCMVCKEQWRSKA